MDFLAGLLGYKRVGIIISQATRQKAALAGVEGAAADYIINTQELVLMARSQVRACMHAWGGGGEGAE